MPALLDKLEAFIPYSWLTIAISEKAWMHRHAWQVMDSHLAVWLGVMINEKGCTVCFALYTKPIGFFADYGNFFGGGVCCHGFTLAELIDLAIFFLFIFFQVFDQVIQGCTKFSARGWVDPDALWSRWNVLFVGERCAGGVWCFVCHGFTLLEFDALARTFFIYF